MRQKKNKKTLSSPNKNKSKLLVSGGGSTVRDDQGIRQGCNEAKPSATHAIVQALAQAPSGWK